MNELLNIFPRFTHVVERSATPSWRIREEICQVYNLILIYDGRADFFCNGDCFRGGPGDLIFFKPGERRSAHTFPDNLMKCFAVDFLYTCPVWEQGEWRLIHPELPFATIQKITDPYLLNRLLDLFGEFAREWLSGRQNKIGRCRAVFMEMLNLLLMNHERTGINYDKIRKVERVIQYMAGHYGERISLALLSRVAQISPSYLGSIFKEVTGKTPIDYLIGIRIDKAKELLRDGFSVSETAYRVGFGDVFYFSKCYKKWEGVAPSRARQEG